MPHWSHATGKASAPSLRQHELDQVQRVTALPMASSISAPCRDTPGEDERMRNGASIVNRPDQADALIIQTVKVPGVVPS